MPIAAMWSATVASLMAQPMWFSLCCIVLMSVPAMIMLLAHGAATWDQFVQTGGIRALYEAPATDGVALRLVAVCLGRSVLRILWCLRATGKPAQTLLPKLPSLLILEIAQLATSLAAALCLAPILQALRFDAAESWHVWAGFERAAQECWQQIVWHSLTALWPQAELAVRVSGDWAPAWVRLPLGVGLLVIGALSFRLSTLGTIQSRLSLGAVLRLGWSRLWVSVRHLGLLWALTFAAQGLLIEAPIAFVTHGLVPHVVRATGVIGVIPLVNLGAALCSLLASAVWLVVATGYESRLVQALTAISRSQ